MDKDLHWSTIDFTNVDIESAERYTELLGTLEEEPNIKFYGEKLRIAIIESNKIEQKEKSRICNHLGQCIISYVAKFHRDLTNLDLIEPLLFYCEKMRDTKMEDIRLLDKFNIEDIENCKFVITEFYNKFSKKNMTLMYLERAKRGTLDFFRKEFNEMEKCEEVIRQVNMLKVVCNKNNLNVSSADPLITNYMKYLETITGKDYRSLI